MYVHFVNDQTNHKQILNNWHVIDVILNAESMYENIDHITDELINESKCSHWTLFQFLFFFFNI